MSWGYIWSTLSALAQRPASAHGLVWRSLAPTAASVLGDEMRYFRHTSQFMNAELCRFQLSVSEDQQSKQFKIRIQRDPKCVFSRHTIFAMWGCPKGLMPLCRNMVCHVNKSEMCATGPGTSPSPGKDSGTAVLEGFQVKRIAFA